MIKQRLKILWHFTTSKLRHTRAFFFRGNIGHRCILELPECFVSWLRCQLQAESRSCSIAPVFAAAPAWLLLLPDKAKGFNQVVMGWGQLQPVGFITLLFSSNLFFPPEEKYYHFRIRSGCSLASLSPPVTQPPSLILPCTACPPLSFAFYLLALLIFKHFPLIPLVSLSFLLIFLLGLQNQWQSS